MRDLFLELYVKTNSILARENAQDVAEYALAICVIALGTIAGMQAIATSVNDTFIVVTNVFTNALARS